MADATKDYYLILGVSPDESFEGIRDAFRELALRHHPDRAGTTSTPTFQEISEAYDVLSDAKERAAYDRSRRQPRRTQPATPPPYATRVSPRNTVEPLVPRRRRFARPAGIEPLVPRATASRRC